MKKRLRHWKSLDVFQSNVKRTASRLIQRNMRHIVGKSEERRERERDNWGEMKASSHICYIIYVVNEKRKQRRRSLLPQDRRRSIFLTSWIVERFYCQIRTHFKCISVIEEYYWTYMRQYRQSTRRIDSRIIYLNLVIWIL